MLLYFKCSCGIARAFVVAMDFAIVLFPQSVDGIPEGTLDVRHPCAAGVGCGRLSGFEEIFVLESKPGGADDAMQECFPADFVLLLN